MSDDNMWRTPDDLADRVAAGDYREAWGREIERTAEVRAILTDLIKDLREHADSLDGGPDGYQDFWDAQRDARDLTDRAEARLREVGGDE